MDYMIYIYAALAFVIAGGSGFICWHAGHRHGRREGFIEGRLSRVNFAEKEKTVEGLRSLIAKHQARMDRDDS